ncbi:MAG: hypothetical protein WC601_10870 [Desulfotomaculaceae bacterium]
MNIYGITAILQEMAYQSNSLTSPAARTEAAARVHDVTTAAQKAIETEGVNLTAGQSMRVEAQQTTPQPLPVPVFIPLPLRSELFPEVRFFARPEEEKSEAKAAGHKEIMDIFKEVSLTSQARSELGAVVEGLLRP